MFKAAAYLVAFYGALNIIGGNLGYRQKKSMPSLIAGVTFGDALFLSAIGIYVGRMWGVYFAVGITIFLLLFFCIRYILNPNHPFIPSGLMSIVSGLMLLALYFMVGRG